MVSALHVLITESVLFDIESQSSCKTKCVTLAKLDALSYLLIFENQSHKLVILVEEDICRILVDMVMNIDILTNLNPCLLVSVRILFDGSYISVVVHFFLWYFFLLPAHDIGNVSHPFSGCFHYWNCDLSFIFHWLVSLRNGSLKDWQYLV